MCIEKKYVTLLSHASILKFNHTSKSLYGHWIVLNFLAHLRAIFAHEIP